MLRILKIAIAIIAAAFVTASPALTQSPSAEYQLTELEIPSGYTTATAAAINDVGQIVGNAGQWPATPVLWQNGTVTELPTLGGQNCVCFAYGINNGGQIVGYCTVNSVDHAVLWENGTITELATFEGGGPTRAIAINNHGQIAGYASTSSSPLPMHAALWQNGTVTDLGTLPDDWLSFAQGINDLGQIVGGSLSATFTSRVFMWWRGRFTVLPTARGYAQPWGINEVGQVVGDGLGVPVVWEHDTVTKLPGGYGSARGINNRGQIVGSSNGQPVLWENGERIELPTSGASGGTAASINNGGRIVGSIQLPGGFPPTYHPVLWKR